MGSEAEALAEAMVEYEYIAAYCKRNEVKGFEAEAGFWSGGPPSSRIIPRIIRAQHSYFAPSRTREASH